MKLGWLCTDEYGVVTFHQHQPRYCSGTWERIAYFPIEDYE